MFTGSMDVNKIGLLTAWNYSDQYTAYDGDCGKVKGSVGDLWPFNAAHQRNISLFIPDFCGLVLFLLVAVPSMSRNC